MKDQTFMFTCEICNGQYQMGKHIYNGKHILRYQLGVCRECYDRSWNGWSSQDEKKVIKHLEGKKFPIPERNENGLLPRD